MIIQELIRQKLEEFEWEVLPHPAYSPDLTPFDYHPFHSLRIYLATKRFDDEENLKSDLEVFFSSLSKKFCKEGIVDLLKRWKYVIDNNGVDVID